MFSHFDPIGESIKKCPFLHALVMTEGESFARNVAENYSKTTELSKRVEAQEVSPMTQLQNVAKNFTVFHGEEGILPLKNGKLKQTQGITCGSTEAFSAVRALPTASISLSGFWGDFNPFKKPGQKQSRSKKPSRSHASGSQSHGVTAGNVAGGGGQCPMRRILGPVATIVMSRQYHCPKPIVMMRAALAKTSMVRALRPESLEIKLLAVALASSVLNIPFGMLREHTRKFSPQWFLVVHATIPFIAMFRKAVVMPQYAILFTIAAAIGGQAIGAKAEKRRIEWIASQETTSFDGETDDSICTRKQEWAVTASMTTPPISV